MVEGHPEAAASTLRSDVVRVWHEPATISEGTEWSAFIEFNATTNVSAVKFQVCRVGNVCFNPSTPAQRINATTWGFESANVTTLGRPVDWKPGWLVGYEWYLGENADDPSNMTPFPEGVDVVSPDCESREMECAATHYFVFSVQTGRGGAIGLGDLATWGAIGTAIAGGVLLLLRWRIAPQRPRARRATVIAATVLLVGAGMLGAFSAWDHANVVQPAPDFHLQTTGYGPLGEGPPSDLTLSGLRGQTVVLDMMAVTCTSCRLVTTNVLKPLWAHYGNRSGFHLLSIDTWADPATGYGVGETREELVRLQARDGLVWPHALDTDRVYQKFAAIELPKVVVIDTQGDIVFEKAGQPSLADVRAAVEASMAGTASAVPVFRGGLIGLAVVAGAASFFSPCSIGLVPAYFGFLLGTGQGETTPAVRTRRALRGGVLTGAGIVTLYAGVAVLMWLAGPFLRPYVPRLGPVMAALLILLGALMLFKVSWERIGRWMGMGRVDGRRGFFAFGIGYGLAAFGCTGPVFLPVLLAGFLEGPATGLLVFAAYALSMALLLVLAALLVVAGQMGPLRKVLAHSLTVSRAAGALMVLSGIYLLWFYLH